VVKINKFIIRNASKDEMQIIADWSKIEQWNPGEFDAVCFYNSDPSGFFVGELNREVIGCISAFAYDKEFGFIGLYIVKPEYRRKGYGIQIWKKAMDYLDDRCIGLDGVIEQVPNYEKFGFRSAYSNIRLKGIAGENISLTGEQSHDKKLMNLSTVPLSKLVSYDSGIFPAIRERFLENWLSMDGTVNIGYLEDENLKGYGILRKSTAGFRIGPLFADSNHIAKKLYSALVMHVYGKEVIIDVPEINYDAIQLFEKYGYIKIFETSRMYNKKPKSHNMEKVYGVTTLELG